MDESIYEKLGASLIRHLSLNRPDTIDSKTLVEHLFDAMHSRGLGGSAPAQFAQGIELVDQYLGEDKAFSLIDTSLISKGYYSFAISCYLILIRRFKYNVNISRKLALFVQAIASQRDLSDHEWWIYCHAAYLTGNYEALSNVSAELRRREKTYDRALNQYLMFDVMTGFAGGHLDIEHLSFITNDWSGCNLPCQGDGVIPIIACDSRYFNAFVVPKFQTLTSREVAIHIALADPTDQDLEILLNLRGAFPKISHSIHKFHGDECVSKDTDLHQAKERRLTFYASLRFLVAHTLINKTTKALFTIDADTTLDFDELNGFVSSLHRHLGDADLGIKLWDFDYGPGTSHEADLVFFGQSDQSKYFIKLLESYLLNFLTSSYCFWTLDQVAINACRRFAEITCTGFRLINLRKLDPSLFDSYRNTGGSAFRA